MRFLHSELTARLAKLQRDQLRDSMAIPSADDTRASSETPSRTPSICSYNSSSDILFEAYGRTMSSINDVHPELETIRTNAHIRLCYQTYAFPVDAREHARQDVEHRYITLALGSLYSAGHAVETALQVQDDCAPQIAEMGSGSGAWHVSCHI